MENNFFNDILYYVDQYMSGVDADIEEYASENPYYRIWKKGHQMILDGASETSMRVALKYEKELLIKDSNLTKDELLEVILMEHIIYSIHSGKLYQIAELAQTFAAQDIMMKYSDVITRLYGTDEEMKHAKSYSLCLSAAKQDMECEGYDEEEG